MIHNQCGLPEIKRIDFYSSNDRSFGQFLRENSCSTRTLCNRCQKPLLSHTLQILHNGISIAVTSANVGTAKQNSDVIRVWRYVMIPFMKYSRCRCGHEASPEVVSNATLHLSMGVVLQLLFYDSTSLGPCGHRLFGDRVRYIVRMITIDPVLLTRKYAYHIHICSYGFIQYYKVWL